MDLLSLILTCSLYLEDDALVRAVAESNSDSNPDFVFDAAADATQVDPPPAPRTVDAAVARAEDITAKRGRPLLGLMQVPPEWMSVFGQTLRSAFEPCTNIAVGTAMLSQFDAECTSPHEKAVRSLSRSHATSTAGLSARRACVLAQYGEAIGLADFVTLTRLELRYQRPARPAVEDAPIFASPGTRDWGPDMILVSPSSLSLLPSPSP
jgi:hypothetical protein